jgi:hypothetical protein
MFQISASGIFWTFSQPRPFSSSEGTSRAASSMNSRPTQVGACTPLVIEPIGTSSRSNPGQSSLNMSRLTSPCSSETPLTRWARRMPMTAMLNLAGSASAPSARIRSTGTVGQALSPPNWRAIMSTGKRSMPAGTGVCVVNTVPARTTSSASSKESRASVSSRMRSTPRKPAWPSLVWKTSGSAWPVTRQ